MKKVKNTSEKIVTGQIKKMIPFIIVLFLICSITCIIELIIPYIDKSVVNDGLLKGDQSKFIRLLIISFMATLLSKLISFVGAMIFNKFSCVMIQNIKKEVFRRLTALPEYIFSSNQGGYIKARMDETDVISGFFSPVVFKIITSTVTMIGALIYIFKLDFTIFLITLASAPIIYFICTMSSKKVSKLSENINESEAKLSGQMQEYIQGAAEIKQLNLENKANTSINCRLENITSKSIKRSNRIEGGTTQTSLVCSIVQLIVTLVVGIKIMNNGLSLGDYVSVSRYISYVFSPIILFSTYYLSIQEAIVASKRINNFFSAAEEKSEYGKHLSNVKNIRFENVSFSYDNKNNILTDVNLEINSHDKVNIYGKNGCGKTTLIKMITGLKVPTSGKVYVNNIPIEDINLPSLRSHIGVLSQDSYLFSGSVISNIISSPEDLDVWRNICTNEVFRDLDWEKGVIVENGKNISSGQKQKIVLARLMIKNPDVIVIDEGITNLDIESKSVIINAVDTLFKDKICIFVSHSDDFSDCVNRKLLIKNRRITDIYQTA
ncbi:MAG: ABC transporter ATP-binding protein [Oscillospiraceae bacterium]|nr:ABC transporter ATP-binding protein [Oscillospiraceae bacterium]